MDVQLAGQVAVVTGASSGLGHRFATTLAIAGARVALMGRRLDRLEALAVELGASCVPIQLDVCDAGALEGAVTEAEAKLGPVSILVNNAGMPDAQYATRMSLELVDQVIATNMRAPWLLSCEVARRLIARGAPGRIVNVSSIGSFLYGGGGAALYSVTKAAVNRMTEVHAVEWAQFNINVNAIAPGAFDSEMMAGMIERQGDRRETFPRKRMGDPAQLDSTLLYLCAPESEFVTGTIIKVDDGQHPR